jgi:hypothetical protein
MKKCALLIVLAVSCAFADTAEQVSIIHLIANPARYHGKRVIISGFLNMEFEGNAIYLHRDDYAFSQYGNGLWCSIDMEKYEKYNRRYVVLEGTFNGKMKGHLGMWSGSVERISRVWEPVRPKQAGK